jgi:hypothetical protein
MEEEEFALYNSKAICLTPRFLESRFLIINHKKGLKEVTSFIV